MSAGTVIVGATGYTGRLVVDALPEAAVAGRDRARLEAFGRAVEVLDTTDPAACAALAARYPTVISCVGPFHLWGWELAQACAEAGGVYLDVTGELPFVRRSTDELDGIARRSGSLLLHSCAFESLPADLLGALLLRDGPVDDLSSWYAFEQSRVSPGTRLTARLAGLRGFFLRRDGAWKEAEERDRSRPFGPGLLGVLAPYPEVLWFDAARNSASYMVVPASDAGLLGARGSRLGEAEILERHRKRKDDGPSAEDRAATTFTITVSATRAAETRSLSLVGADPYGLTATIVAEASRRLGSDRPSGVLAPHACFDPDTFLSCLPARLVAGGYIGAGSGG